MISIVPLAGIGEIEEGCDLAGTLSGALVAAGAQPTRDDVLVVTQKIISKAEGCWVDLRTVEPGEEAQKLAASTGKDPRVVQLILSESSAVIKAVPDVLITRHRTGHIMANAGIDRSNLGTRGGDHVLLLPRDADESAASLRAAMRRFWPEPPAIIIADSFGRPWRYGVVNVAIGASGLPTLIDKRGETDRDGRPLEVTQIALGDMLAAAAGLVMGESLEGIPAALVTGLPRLEGQAPASALIRAPQEDLFA